MENIYAFINDYMFVIRAFAILLAGFLFGVVMSKILTKVEKEIIKKTKTEIDDIIFPIFKRGVIYAIYIITVLLFLRELKINETFIKTIGVIIFGILIARMADKILLEIEKRILPKMEERLEVMMPLFRKLTRYTIYLLTILIAIDTLGYDITPLVAGMGVAGLAVSLAAKDTISNIISGIFIIIDKPFKIGDRIEIWNAPRGYATWGEVIDIGLRSTKIKTTDDIVIVIPNAEIARRDIINYTAITPKIRIRLPVSIAYESDFEKAEKILLNIVDTTEGIAKEPKPYVIIKNLGESSIDMELRFWIEHAKYRRTIASTVYKRILKEFKSAGIEIPYPKREIYVKELKMNENREKKDDKF